MERQMTKELETKEREEENEPEQDEIARMYKELAGIRMVLESQGEELRKLQGLGPKD